PEKAGAFSSGFRIITPTTRNAIVPIFMKVLRYARGVNSIHTGRIAAAIVYRPIARVTPWCDSVNHWPKLDSATFLPKTTARNITVTPTTVASLTDPGRHLNM